MSFYTISYALFLQFCPQTHHYMHHIVSFIHPARGCSSGLKGCFLMAVCVCVCVRVRVCADRRDPGVPLSAGRRSAMAEPDYLEGDCDELIRPKKLINPVKTSRNHQDLHRELMMNQKRSGGNHMGLCLYVCTSGTFTDIHTICLSSFRHKHNSLSLSRSLSLSLARSLTHSPTLTHPHSLIFIHLYKKAKRIVAWPCFGKTGLLWQSSSYIIQSAF